MDSDLPETSWNSLPSFGDVFFGCSVGEAKTLRISKRNAGHQRDLIPLAPQERLSWSLQLDWKKTDGDGVLPCSKLYQMSNIDYCNIDHGLKHCWKGRVVQIDADEDASAANRGTTARHPSVHKQQFWLEFWAGRPTFWKGNFGQSMADAYW